MLLPMRFRCVVARHKTSLPVQHFSVLIIRMFVRAYLV